MGFPISQFEKDQVVLTSLYAKIGINDQGKKAMFSISTGLGIILTDGRMVTVPKNECSSHVVAIILERIKLGSYTVIKALVEDPTFASYSVAVIDKPKPQMVTTITQKLDKK